MRMNDIDLYQMVLAYTLSVISPADQECLALNAYYESRNQSYVGMIAVTQTVLNRVEDTRFPNTICDVVKQGRLSAPLGEPIRIGQCQFSWYCDGLSDTPTDDVAWETAQRKSTHAFYLHSMGYDLTEGSTHYHSTSVYPDWADTLTRIGQVDDHIFYRWEK